MRGPEVSALLFIPDLPQDREDAPCTVLFDIY